MSEDTHFFGCTALNNSTNKFIVVKYTTTVIYDAEKDTW
jgi:hypothetical protein